MKKLLISIVLLLPVYNGALAKEKTVTLSIPSMHCPVCPITVSRALNDVDGVKKVKVSLKTKLAVVTYDDQETSVKELEETTEFVGYPSFAQ